MMDFKFFIHSVDSVVYEVVPCSLIKTLGHPNIVITCSNKKCVDVSMLQSFTGVASTHIVKYSIGVMMYLAPILFVGGLIGPTKSISHLYNNFNATYGHNGISSLLEGFSTL